MDESKITEADKVCLFSLLKKVFSSSISDQKRAARELRRLTSAAHLLLDPELQEDLITLVHNISVHEKNKRPIAGNPIVVPLLIETLKTRLTIQTKSNAAASLFTLATFDCNKVIIRCFQTFD
ncbi:U-box domain-containing protein 9 [Camellia lanceoleosa]|uniref:U-box domain-containing protein 9 n=1 Tax=Camellia lanceoleosa TaxID=1840588 RepID=A0ACC0H7N9_9ERIC|nr:U-box domain-containing protein 9 [Camellia lanceoleosa]